MTKKIIDKNNISNSLNDFLSYFVSSDYDIDFRNDLNKKNIDKLCSHANTCKFKRKGHSINTCFHTITCQFYCQEFTEDSYLKNNDIEFKDYINEANLAKFEKRLRNF